MLKAEDAKEISKYQPQKRLELQINRIDEIKSINDLEFVLMEIIRFLRTGLVQNRCVKTFVNQMSDPLSYQIKGGSNGE